MIWILFDEEIHESHCDMSHGSVGFLKEISLQEAKGGDGE